MSSSANDRQVAGNHYKMDYQHWDFVTDVMMAYLPACATKYLTRWRSKNGLQDLQKAEHYLSKAIERNVTPAPEFTSRVDDCITRFASQLPVAEYSAVVAIARGEYSKARDIVRDMIGASAD